MKHIVTIYTATGMVQGEWMGGDEQVLPPVVGRTYVEVPDDGQSYIGMRWLGGISFEDVASVPVTTMSPLDFHGLFTPSERAATRALDESGDDQVADALMALQLAAVVDRVDTRVGSYLDMLVAKGVLTSARKTAILAGTVPPS